MRRLTRCATRQRVQADGTARHSAPTWNVTNRPAAVTVFTQYLEYLALAPALDFDRRYAPSSLSCRRAEGFRGGLTFSTR